VLILYNVMSVFYTNSCLFVFSASYFFNKQSVNMSKYLDKIKQYHIHSDEHYSGCHASTIMRMLGLLVWARKIRWFRAKKGQSHEMDRADFKIM